MKEALSGHTHWLSQSAFSRFDPRIASIVAQASPTSSGLKVNTYKKHIEN